MLFSKWIAASVRLLVPVSLVLTLNSAVRGQTADPSGRLEAYERHMELVKSSPFSELPWQFLGPTNVSGRVTDVAIPTPRGQNFTMFLACASGGVWRSVNEGTTWEPVFEHAASTSIGDVTVAPSDPDIVWIGTGEANIFRSSMAGVGVFKSTDGGDTWKHMGLTGTHTIPRIVIHPDDPNVVYVASSGHEWADNPERGVYKTMDGGETWDHVFFLNERSGSIDLVMDPSHPDTLYTATWQRVRKRGNDPRTEPDHDSSAIFKTTNGGASWTEVTKGLPQPNHRGRIGIDLCLTNPDVLYAFVDNYSIPSASETTGRDAYGRGRQRGIKGAEVYRSDDGGAGWHKVSADDRQMRRLGGTYGWVFGQIRVDPNDENTIYVMGLGLNMSTDGGKTFQQLRGMHGDHHALWINPDNSNYLVNGHDGGANISYDHGKTWRRFTENLPVVQFYNVAYDMAEPFHVYGSIQDHGSRQGTVDIGRGRDRIRPVEWEGASGGEASAHAVDPTNSNTLYSEGFYGSITRTNLATGERKSIAPRAAEGEPSLRGQWLAPFILSPHNPRVVYHGMNFLFRSMNQGDKFERISPDLTYNDPEKMGDIPFQTIWAIAESPFKFGQIYVGTDDGRVHRTDNGGIGWREITLGLVPHRWVSRIVASQHTDGTVYLAQNGKRHEDFTAYLWKSTDHGNTWQSIVANIPGGPINVVREDPQNEKVLYVGTDVGVYVTVDGAESWHALGHQLPSTFVHDIAIHPRDNIMVIATHGRGMYAMDVLPIQNYGKEGDEVKTDSDARSSGR